MDFVGLTEVFFVVAAIIAAIVSLIAIKSYRETSDRYYLWQAAACLVVGVVFLTSGLYRSLDIPMEALSIMSVFAVVMVVPAFIKLVRRSLG